MRLAAVMLCAIVLAPPARGQTAPPAARGQVLTNLLLNIYLESARVQDLLSLTHADSWKAEQRSQYAQAAANLRDQLQTLEKWRYQFQYHQSSADFAQQTLNALTALLPTLQKAAVLVSQNGGAAAGAQYEKTSDGFKNLAAKLQSELAARFPRKFAAKAAVQPAPQAKATAPAPAAPVASSTAPGESAAAKTTAAPAAPSTPPPQGPKPAASATAAASTVPGQQLTPAQLKGVLQKVFLASARVKDLLSLALPEKWKMTLAERSLFNEKLRALQTQLGTLEKKRYNFFYHPENIDAAQGTVEALGALVPGIRAVASAVAQYQSASDGAQISKAGAELASASEPLESYVEYLLARRQQQLAKANAALTTGSKGLEVERIAPRVYAPPVTAPVVIVKPPLSPAQVKAILYKIYVSYYRIRDLLTQEHPEQWKTSKAEQMLASQARDTLLARLASVEKWRGRFSEYPDNVYYGFETYIVVSDLLHPLWLFSREVSRNESVTVGADYVRRASDLDEQLHLLLPYFRFDLKRYQEGYGQYQADLANCQTQLGYAMHGFIQHATPIRNVVPAFEGRRAPKSRDKKTARKSR